MSASTNPDSQNTRYIIRGKPKPPGCPVGKKFINDFYRNSKNYNKLCVARASLFNAFPFWGHLAMTMPLVEDTTGYIPTMATDAQNIYWRSEFVEKYPPVELMFVLAHEVYHVLSHHVGRSNRRGDRNHLLWNKAGDFFINDELIEMQCGRPPTAFPLCYDPKYHGLTTELIYNDLAENGDNGKQSFDEHLEIDPDWNGTPEDADAQDKQMQNTWTDRVFRAEAAATIVQSAANSSSKLTDSIKRMLEELHAPKKDWRTILRKYVRAVMRKAYSYRNPNKNLFQYGITTPGFRSKSSEYDLFVAIDCSASISIEMLTKFISEIMNLTKQLPSFRVGIGSFDSMFYDESFMVLTKQNKSKTINVEPFLNNIRGGGATLFESVWEWMKEKKIKPKAMIVFTDGYPNCGWGDPSYCPTLFLIAPLGEEYRDLPTPVAPFGRTVYYEN